MISTREWRTCVARSLAFLGDATLQREAWIEGKAVGERSAPEACRNLLELLNPDSFLDHHWERFCLDREQCQMLKGLESALLAYRLPRAGDCDHEAILNDPAWHQIQALARESHSKIFGGVDWAQVSFRRALLRVLTLILLSAVLGVVTVHIAMMQEPVFPLFGPIILLGVGLGGGVILSPLLIYAVGRGTIARAVARVAIPTIAVAAVLSFSVGGIAVIFSGVTYVIACVYAHLASKAQPSQCTNTCCRSCGYIRTGWTDTCPECGALWFEEDGGDSRSRER